MRWDDRPYHSLDYELKKRFGEKIYKIALDAGMTCPNRESIIMERSSPGSPIITCDITGMEIPRSRITVCSNTESG